MIRKLERSKINQLIYNERDFQDIKFPHQVENWNKLDESKKYLILAEEVGEVAKAILEKDRENQLEELVQVAAICYKWLEFWENP